MAQGEIAREAQSNLRRILISMVVVGLVAAAAATTFATFTAQTNNPATIANATVTMTNVVGTLLLGESAQCGTATGTATGGATCNITFTANNTDSNVSLGAGQTNLKPGGAAVTNTVTITYTGSITTSLFRLFASTYASKGAGSSSLCTAAAAGVGSPGTKLLLQIAQSKTDGTGSFVAFPVGGLTTDFGTFDTFATTYTSSGAGLALRGGAGGAGSVDAWNTSDASRFTISVKLDASADNTYQGCQTTATFSWFTIQ